MISNDTLQRRLIYCLIVYECFVIGSVAYTGITIALAGGAPVFAALPVLLVSASESLRIPLSGWASKLSAGNRLLGVFVLGLLALASAEGISLSLDTLFDARIKLVAKQQRILDLAQGELASRRDKALPLEKQITSLEQGVVATNAQMTALISNPPTAPGFSGKTCRGKSCGADLTAQATYRRVLAARSKEMADLKAKVYADEGKLEEARHDLSGIDLAGAAGAVSVAERAVQDAAEDSPVHRIAAAIFGVSASKLTFEQFSNFRFWAISGVSFSLASMSALVGWLAFQEPAPKGQSKLSRALRAYIARRRKPLVRTVVKPVPSGTRTKFIYVPVNDDAEGLLKKAGYRRDKVKAYEEML